ncbi:MAG TPA: NnrS family protein [Roseiarcus sp.]|nr:NnrS family protein [Roseiarcus sp.]
MAPTPRFKADSSPALFSAGFRPFFLLGAIWAGAAIALWLPAYFGELTIATAFSPRDWHIHEMLYGYVSAVVAGFLLTAIPNWTGRLPLQGWPLVGLTACWIIGRIAVAFSAFIGGWVAAGFDLLFLTLLISVAARELSHGAQNHNIRVLAVLCVFLVGNVIFHVEALVEGEADYGVRIGLAAVLTLIMLIGGRIVPSFTRNWLARENPGPLPAAPGRFDLVAIAAAAAALLAWVIVPTARATGAALILAAGLHAIRLARWRGERTWRDRLVFVLHIGYFFVPLGFLATGLSVFGLAPVSAGVHLWTVGAVGTMTLAVMSRASLGHTGRALVASANVQAVYVLVIAAALVRACAALLPDWSAALLIASGVAWISAFLGFAGSYWIILTHPRRLR